MGICVRDPWLICATAHIQRYTMNTQCIALCKRSNAQCRKSGRIDGLCMIHFRSKHSMHQHSSIATIMNSSVFGGKYAVDSISSFIDNHDLLNLAMVCRSTYSIASMHIKRRKAAGMCRYYVYRYSTYKERGVLRDSPEHVAHMFVRALNYVDYEASYHFIRMLYNMAKRAGAPFQVHIRWSLYTYTLDGRLASEGSGFITRIEHDFNNYVVYGRNLCIPFLVIRDGGPIRVRKH